ncbi:MAG: hypothetical protein HY901_35660 [Deltaproteobacteria bacterium]|nr:hypothetical protein [Deltaproteobacteria bacterium]
MSARMPLFRLPDEQGSEVGTLDAHQRAPCLVALLHGDGGGDPACAQPLEELARRSRSSGLEGAAVFGVSLGRQLSGWAAGAPFPVLREGDASVAGAMAVATGRAPGEPLLVAADRYGEICGAWLVHGRTAQETIDDAVEAVRFVEQQCPE